MFLLIGTLMILTTLRYCRLFSFLGSWTLVCLLLWFESGPVLDHVGFSCEGVQAFGLAHMGIVRSLLWFVSSSL